MSQNQDRPNLFIPHGSPPLMTPDEAARYLRLTEDLETAEAASALGQLVAKGQIHPCSIGPTTRFAKFELDRFIKDQTQRAISDANRQRDPKTAQKAFRAMKEATHAPVQNDVQGSPRKNSKGGKVVRRVQRPT